MVAPTLVEFSRASHLSPFEQPANEDFQLAPVQRISMPEIGKVF